MTESPVVGAVYLTISFSRYPWFLILILSVAAMIPADPIVLFLFWYPLPELRTVTLETTLFVSNALINCLPTPYEVKSIGSDPLMASDLVLWILILKLSTIET